MAPPLRLDDWSRLYEPDGFMRLYQRVRPNDLHRDIADSWIYCDTEDPVQALARLVYGYPDRAWELAWSNNGDMTVIANSEHVGHFRRLIERSNFFTERDGNFRLRQRA